MCVACVRPCEREGAKANVFHLRDVAWAELEPDNHMLARPVGGAHPEQAHQAAEDAERECLRRKCNNVVASKVKVENER